MLYLLFTATFLIPAFLGIGIISEKLCGSKPNAISLSIVRGMVCLSIIYTILAFFIPINIYVEIISLTVGIFACFFLKKFESLWNLISQNLTVGLPALLIILLSGSFFPFILDHFGYYIPTIKWINEIGLVKGISNLDLLLGQMSIWHILQSGLSNFSDPFFRLNSVLIIIYLLYILERKCWLHLIFIPVMLLFAQSPSPDLPTFIFSLIILNEILSGNKKGDLLFAFSAYIFAVKPTMIWVPFFTFLYLFFELKGKMRAIVHGIMIIILFMFKNIWTFGYPIFPVQIADLGLAWKPNTESLKISSEIALQKTFDMQFTISEIKNFTPFEYIKNWLTLKGIKSVIHISFIIILLWFGAYTFIKKKKIITFLFVSILVKSIFVLLFSAQYRFFIDVFFVAALIMLAGIVTRKNAVLTLITLSLGTITFLAFPNIIKSVFPSFKLGHYMLGFSREQLIKPSHFELNAYKTHQIGNLKFNVVEGYPFSFDIPLPAISPQFLQEYHDAAIFPQKISDNIRDGFVWRKMTASEQYQLKKILEEHKTK